MIQLSNRQILDDGTVICTVDAAIEMLYAGKPLGQAILEPNDDVDLYNRSNAMLDLELDPLLTATGQCFGDYPWYDQWSTPEPWSTMSVLDYCIDRCTDDEQRIRVCEEYQLFDERSMIPVLRHLIWMVNDMRSRGIFWGVGRGSSVSSYMLYLIGINRINPMQFDLDVREFLK